MKRIEISDKEKNKIINLKNNGESIRGICREINRSQSFVQRILNEKNKKKKEKFKKEEGKNFVAICKKTKKEFKDYKNKGGSLTHHISKEFKDVVILSKFLRKKFEIENGFNWCHNYFDIIKVDEVKNDVLKCKFCLWDSTDLDNKSGSLTKHLNNEHNIDYRKYIEIFPEEKRLFKTLINKYEYKEETESDTNNFIECEVCGEKMRKITNTHLKKHGLSLKNYRKKFGDTMSNKTKDKFIEIGRANSESIVKSKKNTKIEIKIRDILDRLKIDYIQQYKIKNYYYDFYLKDKGILIEIDGSFWHGQDRESEWDYIVFNNVINDYKKSKDVDKLYRIGEIVINNLNINDFNTKEYFYKFIEDNNIDINCHKIFNLKENDIIFSKNYCINKFDINNKNTKKLINNILFLWKNFYSPCMHDRFVNLETRKDVDFRIKGIFFEQFYSAHKIKNKNLFNLFKSDELLIKIIKYRLGINKNKEFFDFNIKNLYRGIEVYNLFNVGIFPVKKSNKIFNSNIDANYLIFDPFAGWGSRIISLDKILTKNNCRYIGNDINKELMSGYDYIINNEINKLSKNKTSIRIKDSTIFDEDLINKVDFIFTSPPFFNDEIYEESTIIHDSIDDWSNNLIIPVFENCFKYLKKDRKMIIDIKELYCEQIINSAKKCGFNLIDSNGYNITKTHYTNKNIKKRQFLLTFLKK